MGDPHPPPQAAPGSGGPGSQKAGPEDAAYTPQGPPDSSSRDARGLFGEAGRPGLPPSPISRRRRVFSGLPSRICVSSSGLKLAAARSLSRSGFMVTASGGRSDREDSGNSDAESPQPQRGRGPKSRPRTARIPASARPGLPLLAPSPSPRPPGA